MEAAGECCCRAAEDMLAAGQACERRGPRNRAVAEKGREREGFAEEEAEAEAVRRARLGLVLIWKDGSSNQTADMQQQQHSGRAGTGASQVFPVARRAWRGRKTKAGRDALQLISDAKQQGLPAPHVFTTATTAQLLISAAPLAIGRATAEG